MTELNKTSSVFLYENKNFEVIVQDDTAWLTQKGISTLFDVDQSGVSRHLLNIFESNELDEKSNMQKKHIANSDKLVQFYSLDVVISVGYRVNTQKATKFRIWASEILKQYIRDGYVINEALLKDDPEKLNTLAAKIRELRATEKNVFAKVRDCFKLSASDYEPSSDEVRSFYILLQDKFHHAITQMTASKLVMDRSDWLQENMGLVSFSDLLPTIKEAQTGKNYLTKDELYRMFLLSEQFLLFAESSALMRKSLTMKQLHEQLDKVLELNGYPIFDGYKDFLKVKALKHAETEYNHFIKMKKLKMIGVEVDIVDYESGLYEEYYETIDAISLKDLKAHYSEKQNKYLNNQNRKLIGN